MRLFNKVAIIGTGLIGGSIALAMKKKGLARKVVGVSRHKSTLSWAKESGAIDKGSQDLSIVRDADLVVLATPVNTILNLADKIIKLVREDCIITDVGSTKKEIVSKFSRIFPNYVGSHPLAGSEKRGIVNIQADIFEKTLCILTPVGNTSPKALKKVKRLWNSLGARVVFLNPDKHDEVLSFVSHLPHAIAFSLVDTVPARYLKFAASGLKDSTRIALSDARLWVDIFLSNRQNMLKTIESFRNNLSRLKSAINKKDKEELIKFLKKAKDKREILK